MPALPVFDGAGAFEGPAQELGLSGRSSRGSVLSTSLWQGMVCDRNMTRSCPRAVGEKGVWEMRKGAEEYCCIEMSEDG